jgi:hypothetical protein
MELLKKNLALIGIIIIVILGAVWYALSAGSGTSTSVEVTDGGVLVATAGDPEAEADPDVLKLLLDMRAIKLDGRLFKSPAFRALQDTGRQILKEPQGRANPFAPAGSEADASFGDGAENQQDDTEASGNIPQFTE